jgi:hypothetical protein
MTLIGKGSAQFIEVDASRDRVSTGEFLMKRVRTGTMMIASVVLSVCAFAFQGAPAQSRVQKTHAKAPMQTFVGMISDGQCAAKGSHKEIMAKAKVNTAANCVKGCARRYWYVLYVPSSKKIYKLSDQERPAELAAKKVRIKGALDQATQTIYVSSIEPVL